MFTSFQDDQLAQLAQMYTSTCNNISSSCHDIMIGVNNGSHTENVLQYVQEDRLSGAVLDLIQSQPII